MTAEREPMPTLEEARESMPRMPTSILVDLVFAGLIAGAIDDSGSIGTKAAHAAELAARGMSRELHDVLSSAARAELDLRVPPRVK